MLYVNTKLKVTGDTFNEICDKAVSTIMEFYEIEKMEPGEVIKRFNIELDIYSTPQGASHDHLYDCTIHAKIV